MLDPASLIGSISCTLELGVPMALVAGDPVQVPAATYPASSASRRPLSSLLQIERQAAPPAKSLKSLTGATSLPFPRLKPPYHVPLPCLCFFRRR